MDRVTLGAAIIVVALVVSTGLLVRWLDSDPAPTPTPLSVVTFSHPAGSLTCGYNEPGISCVPTWWLIPTWMPFEEAKALYELGGANGY